MNNKAIKSICISSVSAMAMLSFAHSAHAELADEGAADDVIIVTAGKREQLLKDVSGSISALSEDDLRNLQAQSLSDYITRVPGVVFNDYQPGVSEVVIRGVASTTYHEANQATTGYYINEIPLTEPGFPLVIPDVDTFDLKRVEVLRGPQGTLFGSSSLGGAINYVVNTADASGFDAGFEGSLASTRRAGEVSYGAKAMVNVPIIEDQLAVRLVAFQRFDAGYLDNTGTGVDGSNDLRVRGLRGSLVWTPTDKTTFSVLSMYQEYDLDDQTYVLFGAPETFERSTNVPEYQDTDFMLHSLTINQQFDFATLTAVGSYTEKNSNLAFDDSIFLGYDARTGTPQLSSSTGKSKTEYLEVRLASTGASPFGWLIGGNYTHLKSDSTGGAYLEGISDYIDANPGEFGGQPGSFLAPGDLLRREVSSNDVKETALFGELSYTFADALTFTAGGRLFRYTSNPRLQFLPNAALTPPFDYQPGKKKESGFIPKFSVKYAPDDDFMLYALYSEGFRIGGINVYSAAAGTPLNFESDTTKNFEIGTRFSLADGSMLFDIAAYHIDWDNIQARLFVPVTFEAYTTNGGGADIDGVELTMTLNPTKNLQFMSSVSYNDARLSSLLPDSFAAGGGYAKGTTLPGASDWTLSNSVSLHFDDAPMKPRFSLAHRYLSNAPVAFDSTLEKGDYHIVDLTAFMNLTDNIELGVYAKNIFDQYGILSAPFSFAGAVVRPRTIGGTVRFSMQ
jgi:outer membrane receptor protein involved in Fe transport|tara:strand:- start:2157 stop:4361 length:2205 start_codon:yes stop_codon:yes gene_type:complete